MGINNPQLNNDSNICNIYLRQESKKMMDILITIVLVIMAYILYPILHDLIYRRR